MVRREEAGGSFIDALLESVCMTFEGFVGSRIVQGDRDPWQQPFEQGLVRFSFAAVDMPDLQGSDGMRCGFEDVTTVGRSVRSASLPDQTRLGVS